MGTRSPVGDVRRFESELLEDLHRNAGGVYDSISGGKVLDADAQKALLAATDKFKDGFLDSEGNRVVNEAEADTLNPDEVSQEQVTVTRKTVSK